MSQHAAVLPGGASSLTFVQRHYFLLRRLHSLSGVLPVGVFVCFHLFTNFQMVMGTFQHEVDFIHNMPALLIVEISGIWLPLAFHAALGIVYTFTGRPTSMKAYPDGDNWRYLLQRITGILALIFIFLHLSTLRWGWTYAGILNTPFYTEATDPATGKSVELAMATTAMAMQHSWWVLAIYIIGVYSAIYHFANGLWTFAITWGLTITKAAQTRWGTICAGLGLALALFAGGATYSALAFDTNAVAPGASMTYEQMVAKLKTGEIPYGHGAAERIDLVQPGETNPGYSPTVMPPHPQH